MPLTSSFSFSSSLSNLFLVFRSFFSVCNHEFRIRTGEKTHKVVNGNLIIKWIVPYPPSSSVLLHLSQYHSTVFYSILLATLSASLPQSSRWIWDTHVRFLVFEISMPIFNILKREGQTWLHMPLPLSVSPLPPFACDRLPSQRPDNTRITVR